MSHFVAVKDYKPYQIIADQCNIHTQSFLNLSTIGTKILLDEDLS